MIDYHIQKGADVTIMYNDEKASILTTSLTILG